jgi:hypothetical protein
VPPDPSVDAFEKFKQMTFWGVVLEWYQPLWDPLLELRGDWAIEGQTEPERQAFAERALRELYAEGLIYFFGIPPGAKIEPSSKDESLRLASDEVESALRADWWRGREDLGEHASDICFAPTEAGEAAAVNPPDYVRRHRRMPDPDA